MREERRQVTVFCPRCASPVFWSVRSFASGGKLTVLRWWCACSLDDDEWDELAKEAGDAPGDGDADDQWGVRRVVEAPLPQWGVASCLCQGP